jgi:hypothetical protein
VIDIKPRSRESDDRRVKTNVTVPAAAISTGGLQQIGVCPRHGRPAFAVRKEKFGSKTPTWVYLLILVALLLAAIIAEAIRKRVEGPVPTCDQCAADKRTFRLQVAGVWIADLVLMVIGAAGSAVALVAWLALTLFALVFSFMSSRYRVQGTVSGDGLYVELKDVDSAFASECHRRMAGGQPQPVVGSTILPS